MSFRSVVSRQSNCLGLKPFGRRAFSNNIILCKDSKSSKGIPTNNNKEQKKSIEQQKIDAEKYNKHVKYLTKFYDPEIVESILLAESAINPEHYAKTRYNHREFAPSYIDDFIKLDPYFDHTKTERTSHLQFLETPPVEEEEEKFTSYDESVQTTDKNYLQQYARVDHSLNQLNVLARENSKNKAGEAEEDEDDVAQSVDELFDDFVEKSYDHDVANDLSLDDVKNLQEDNTIYDREEILGPDTYKPLDIEDSSSEAIHSDDMMSTLNEELAKADKEFNASLAQSLSDPSSLNLDSSVNALDLGEDEEAYFEGLQGEAENANEGDELDEGSESLNKLCQLTGFDAEYISDLKKINLLVKAVSNQTGNGKIQSFFAMVCVGDGQGMLGLGEGKDPLSVEQALNKAYWQAVKNLKKIPLLENRTIFGEVEFKFGASIVQLRTAPPGFGLRVNHHIFKLAQCAGIKDLGGKVYKSRNPMNVVKAATEALAQQKTTEDIALERGKKVIDLRKIYYSA